MGADAQEDGRRRRVRRLVPADDKFLELLDVDRTVLRECCCAWFATGIRRLRKTLGTVWPSADAVPVFAIPIFPKALSLLSQASVCFSKVHIFSSHHSSWNRSETVLSRPSIDVSAGRHVFVPGVLKHHSGVGRPRGARYAASLVLFVWRRPQRANHPHLARQIRILVVRGTVRIP